MAGLKSRIVQFYSHAELFTTSSIIGIKHQILLLLHQLSPMLDTWNCPPTRPSLNCVARSASGSLLPRAKICRTLSGMDVLFTPEIEAKLARSAALQGSNPIEVVRQAVARYFDEESRFVDAVNRGESALLRGESLTHDQVGQRLERFLRP
jgi:predicted transcriptional regulator